MTPATVAFFPPVARKDHLERLEALPDEAASMRGLWDDLHSEIQEQLAILETEVRQKVTGIRVAAGRTQGEQFFLFSYRTFSIPGSMLDPVVAGVTFVPADQGVAVDADVSGEHNGDGIFLVPSKTVGDSREGLLEAARESARELCRSAEAIAKALADQARIVG